MNGVSAAAAALLKSNAVAADLPVAKVASPFSGVLNGLISESADLSSKAQASVSGLLNGSGVDVHEAMIATQKADIAFELALQVRNKAVGAYQQMMAMQF
jgi:flagellar hook-basal body complex protein FliE